jgi:hypothetical protein
MITEHDHDRLVAHYRALGARTLQQTPPPAQRTVRFNREGLWRAAGLDTGGAEAETLLVVHRNDGPAVVQLAREALEFGYRTAALRS